MSRNTFGSELNPCNYTNFRCTTLYDCQVRILKISRAGLLLAWHEYLSSSGNFLQESLMKEMWIGFKFAAFETSDTKPIEGGSKSGSKNLLNEDEEGGEGSKISCHRKPENNEEDPYVVFNDELSR